LAPNHPDRLKVLGRCRAPLEGKVREVERRARDQIDAEAATKH